MSEKKVYYWLKLQNTFFNSLEIKTVLKHEKGAEYVIFWQKLLLEVIDKIDSGFIRYKESIPYTPDVLATITDTDIDTVKGAMSLFVKMGMLEITEKGDLIIDEVIQEMVGRITDESLRKREYRKKISDMKQIGQCPTMSANVPTILEKEIEKEIDIEKDKKTKTVRKTKQLTPEQESFKLTVRSLFSEYYSELYGEPLEWDVVENTQLKNLILNRENNMILEKIKRFKFDCKDNRNIKFLPSTLNYMWKKIVRLK
jgi:predicted phage replisome organizer